MQTIHLDLAVRTVPPMIHAKQGDIGRKFQAILTDNGKAFTVPDDAVFTVWYTGTSGEGNYSGIGDNCAVTVDGNTVVVELITQMLKCRGGGTLCLTLNDTDGSQIGLWNLPYIVEAVPGYDSAEAQMHYTALSEVAQRAVEAAATFSTDSDLTDAGKAADAKATGDALNQKAPDGFGLGGEIINDVSYVADLNNSGLMTGYYYCSVSTENVPDDSFGGGPLYVLNWRNNALVWQQLMNNDLTETYTRRFKDGVWGPWEYHNPPMNFGVEYRTPERYNGMPVYTKLVNCGTATNGAVINWTSVNVIRHCGRIGNVPTPALSGSLSEPTLYAFFYVNNSGAKICINENSEVTGKQAYCQIWYTKE